MTKQKLKDLAMAMAALRGAAMAMEADKQGGIDGKILNQNGKVQKVNG